MTATRSTKEEHQYSRHRKSHHDSKCPFCQIEEGHKQYVEETDNLKVIHNRTPYSIWDGQGVVDHLMIVPKMHTDSLKDLGDDAAVEFMKLLSNYESRGYNVYARAPTSSVKSVVHQHTHLIKLDGHNKRFVLMLRKPYYIRLSW